MRTRVPKDENKSDPMPAGSSTRILAIDDEQDMLTNYRRLLQRAGHECLTSSDPTRIEATLAEFRPDLVITDLMMPDGSGMEVLRKVHLFDPTIPVILVTGHGSIDNAVVAMKNHAADYLTKPFAVEELLGKIQETLSRRLIENSANPTPPTEKTNEAWRRGIVGVTPKIQQVLDLARKVARTDVNVLIMGESGTGKELFARAIHNLSARHNEIFVPVDCASLPENLLESELFGYCKGAFTGANSDKMGLFRFADKGTLFLDEIGEMPVALQSKLLRVLQERQFRPIGGCNVTNVDVRVVAATNRDLNESLREKTFRSDLFYRLNVITLHIPPLRERIEDVGLLGRHFLSQFTRDNHLPPVTLASETLECLKSYHWPGNVRELQNVIERSATLGAGPSIGVEDLPDNIQSCYRGKSSPATATLSSKKRTNWSITSSAIT